jgi:radical SAM superfamily enzyme YgiQ (UPF0313 family)
MTHATLDRWLLVDYAGYAFTPSSLMPDNGLANLAGALIAAGREVEILDYGTVATMRRFSTPRLAARLLRAWDRVRSPRRGLLGRVEGLGLLAVLQACDAERRRLQQRAEAAIADELVARVRARDVSAVGFKLWNGDGFEGSVRLAQHVRRHCPQVRLFAGGPHVDFFMERILRQHQEFDALVFGEGEETIRHLAESGGRADSYGGIPNLLYRRDGDVRRTEERMVADLDELPLPVYDPAVYPAMVGDEKIRILVVDESRGCRNECAFCVHPVKSHRQQRVKSVGRLIREVNVLADRYHVRTFRFAGSCTPYSLLNGFAAELLRTRSDLTYASFGHIRELEQADLPLLRRSGCLALFFGIESGSQPVLDSMRKHVQAAWIPEAIRRTQEAGIFAVGSLIYPAPGDTAETARATLAVLAQRKPSSITLQAPIVAPRTDWFDRPERYGIRYRSRDHYLDAALRWKVKLLLPPALWKPLPVRFNGRSYRQVLKQTAWLAGELRALGIPLSISDENYLMSVRAGMAVEEFREEALQTFFSGDPERLARLVARVNAGPG